MNSYVLMLQRPAAAGPRFAWDRRRAMTETVFNKVIHMILATTCEELKAVLGSLPHGVRFGVARQLDEVGEAYRYESSRHCAYYLIRHEQGVLIWRWCYIATPLESRRLQATIASRETPLDGGLASRMFESATFRSVDNPRPTGVAFHALDFSDYRSLYA
jgi:hypothetical protein